MGALKTIKILGKDLPSVKQIVLALDEQVAHLKKMIPNAREKNIKEMAIQAKNKKSNAQIYRESDKEIESLIKQQNDIKKSYNPAQGRTDLTDYTPDNLNFSALEKDVAQMQKKGGHIIEEGVKARGGNTGNGMCGGNINLGGGLGPLWK